MVSDEEDIVARYFEALHARDINRLMALYAGDAVFVLPTGTKCVGRVAVQVMHEHAFSAGWPTPLPTSMIATASRVAVECETVLADQTLRYTANFFEFSDDRLIVGIRVYVRGYEAKSI